MEKRRDTQETILRTKIKRKCFCDQSQRWERGRREERGRERHTQRDRDREAERHSQREKERRITEASSVAESSE